MTTVSIRDLRNHGGDLVDRAAAGERIVITRAGRAVAELLPLRPAVPAEVLMKRWSRLPVVDPIALRSDIDSVLDSTL